jgi:hypothetical protein
MSQRLVDRFDGQRETHYRRYASGKLLSNGVIKHGTPLRNALVRGFPKAILQRIANFLAIRVTFHAADFNFRIRDDLAGSGDNGNANSAFRRLAHPLPERLSLLGSRRRKLREIRGLQGENFGDALKLLVGVTLVTAAQRTFGKEIHCEQNAQQERQER